MEEEASCTTPLLPTRRLCPLTRSVKWCVDLHSAAELLYGGRCLEMKCGGDLTKFTGSREGYGGSRGWLMSQPSQRWARDGSKNASYLLDRRLTHSSTPFPFPHPPLSSVPPYQKRRKQSGIFPLTMDPCTSCGKPWESVDGFLRDGRHSRVCSSCGIRCPSRLVAFRSVDKERMEERMEERKRGGKVKKTERDCCTICTSFTTRPFSNNWCARAPAVIFCRQLLRRLQVQVHGQTQRLRS